MCDAYWVPLSCVGWLLSSSIVHCFCLVSVCGYATTCGMGLLSWCGGSAVSWGQGGLPPVMVCRLLLELC